MKNAVNPATYQFYTAVAADATYPVSRDNDLLDLMTGYRIECKEFRQRFRSLRVAGPLAFLRLVEETLTE